MVGQLGADVVMSTGTLVAVIILGVVEVALVIYCIIDIVRRPAVLGNRKWVWIVVILLFNLVGSIVYLAIGRVHPPAGEPHGDADLAAGSRAQAAADLLYGPAAAPDDPERQ
jgi:hypothetical protein